MAGALVEYAKRTSHSDTISSEEYLLEVHNAMRKNLLEKESERNNKEKNNDAIFLTKFLNALFYNNINNKTKSNTNLREMSEETFKDNLRVKLLTGIPALRNLTSGATGGFEFETNFGKVIKRMYSLFGEKISIDDIRVSTTQVGKAIPLELDKSLDKFAQVFLENAKNKVLEADKTAEGAGKTTNGEIEENKFSLGHINGKVDINGTNVNINYKAYSNENVERALSIINSSTFSLKVTNDSAATLGTTNPFKVLCFVDDITRATKQWPRFMGCLKASHVHSLDNARLFYRIRFMYELTGYGAEIYKSDDIKANTVDFLISYRRGNFILVESANTIIDDKNIDNYLKKGLASNNNIKSLVFGDVNIRGITQNAVNKILNSQN